MELESNQIISLVILVACLVGGCIFLFFQQFNKDATNGRSQSRAQSQKKNDDADNGNVIQLTDPSDVGFARMAQGSKVAGSTFPSGLKVPSNGTWIVENDTIVKQ